MASLGHFNLLCHYQTQDFKGKNIAVEGMTSSFAKKE